MVKAPRIYLAKMAAKRASTTLKVSKLGTECREKTGNTGAGSKGAQLS
jgi:hypothetical protein